MPIRRPEPDTSPEVDMLRRSTIRMFGFPIRNITLERAVDVIRAGLREQLPAAIYFVNAHCVNVAQGDEDYRAVLQEAAHIFADGVGMRIASILKGTPLVDNVNGTDLFPILCSALAGTGTRVFFLGSAPGIVERVEHWARRRYPDLMICGIRHGFFEERDDGGVVAAIRDTRTDVLLVGMGVPRQEKWIARHLAATGARVAIGVGGLFDVYSGRIWRSPLWARRLGLEWFGRLVQEPERLWRRYLVGNVRFLWLAVRQAVRDRRESVHPVRSQAGEE